ncbi:MULTISPECIES: hypothetical protein [unclassified Pseudomonas]|uniref:hypothetical protein n=1 Tax=unclassified Pseudomonas TaxID=196821 RepID=UPI002447DA36|nr:MULTISPECIES: hypothetical protein [unclassified Pseudomonas]MDH0894863.1 hypothetical protein [Pseudomonas sp. GD03875]MDH1063939.1 hypothetical protein [Pseudomonas sp. GD03985]
MKASPLLIASAFFIMAGCDNNDQKSTQEEEANNAPSIAYEPLLISDDKVGPFSLTRLDTMNVLAYQARSGTMNLMEAIVEDPESTGYVALKNAYSFGPNRYVLVVSTGELGMSCPAHTYALSFDTKLEYVDGHSEIEGCSEIIESLSEGNKLTIKKDGKSTVVYNGIVK